MFQHNTLSSLFFSLSSSLLSRDPHSILSLPSRTWTRLAQHDKDLTQTPAPECVAPRGHPHHRPSTVTETAATRGARATKAKTTTPNPSS
ncbi:MAG: hypothetical protein J3Q66DRAFT_339070 [Benniella sp.]|nr:MAG: hypothetical protein J3Q66DRAFT_339070 [Benniella sp.]